MYVEIVRSRDAPRMPSEVGGRLPAHAAGVGKALLAFSPDDVVQAVIDRGLPAVGPRTITAPGLLLRELRGSGKRESPTRARNPAMASAVRRAPSLAPMAYPVAAMSISGWNGTLDLRRIGPAVKTAALALSRDLQCVDRPAHRPGRSSTLIALDPAR